MKVQHNDLVEVEYSAKCDGKVFDTTSAEEAKKEGVFNERSTYGPVLISAGKRQVIPGFDEALLEAEEGKQQTVSLPAEKAFGQRNPDLVRLVPLSVFQEQNINPYPGLVVELDGRPARIQSVSGGRVRVDFNSDLAGKAVDYTFKVLKAYRTPEEKVAALGKRLLSADASLKDGVASIKLSMKKDLAADVVLKKFRFIEGAFGEAGATKVKFEEEYTA